MGLWLFFKIEQKKVIDTYSKVPNCSFNYSVLIVGILEGPTIWWDELEPQII